MNWRAVWRLSGPLYAEIAFQAIYALNLGNLPPTGAAGTLSIVARRRVTQSKLLVAAILALVSVGGFVALAARTEGLLAPGLDRGLYASAVIGAVYVLELALLWWTGLQVLPAYLASSAVRFLETLPLDERTLSRVALVLVGRLFDLPALACLVATPLVVGVGLGSVAAGVAALFGGVVVLVLAIALALRTGDFFVRRIQGAHAGHRQTAIRWGYLVLWAVPAFAMYGVIALGPDVLKFLGDAQAAGGERLGLTLAVFPLPLGALPALLGTGSPVLGSADAAIALALVAYGLLAVAAAQWLAGAPRALARTIPSGTVPETVRAIVLAPSTVVAAVVRKDLRIASRTPGYAFVILLPLLDALALGLLTLASAATPDAVFALGAAAVSTAALLAVFFGPALFALEATGYGYVRTLPLADRSVLGAKVAMVVLLYLGAAGIVTVLTLGRVFAPVTFLAFIAGEAPAVAAAGLFEFGVLLARARRRGLPLVNLFSGAWWATGVAVPGVIIAGAPLALFQTFIGRAPLPALGAMGLLSVLELGAALGVVLALVRGGR